MVAGLNRSVRSTGVEEGFKGTEKGHSLGALAMTMEGFAGKPGEGVVGGLRGSGIGRTLGRGESSRLLFYHSIYTRNIPRDAGINPS